MPQTFPSLGPAWPVIKSPMNSTIVAAHTSGRDVRAPQYVYPLYSFQVTYNGLDSSGGVYYPGLGSLQTLMGFFLQMQGQANTFLYVDPTDYTGLAQPQGNGDGSTMTFLLGRTIGGWSEPVGWVTTLAAVYLNGGAQSNTTYALTTPNTLTFNTAPSLGVAITADMSWAFHCRFLDDTYDFENFMSGLWRIKAMKFRSIKGT
jgi:hypothetical protein